MTRPGLYFLIFVSVIIGVTVIGHIEILGARPDITLALVVFTGLFSGAFRGLEAGIVAGLLLDIFAFDYMGMNAVLMGLAGCLAGLLGPNVYRESPLTQGLIIFFLSAAVMTVHFCAASAILSGAFRLNIFEYTLHSVVPVSLYTVLVSVPLLSGVFASYKTREMEELL